MSDLLGQLDQWSELWGQSLWRASLQGGIAIALAWGIAHWCRFLSARVRCWVWRLACLKLLVAFVWNQPLALAVLPAGATQPPAAASRTVAAASPRVPQTRSDAPALSALPHEPPRIGTFAFANSLVRCPREERGPSRRRRQPADLVARRKATIIQSPPRAKRRALENAAWLLDLADKQLKKWPIPLTDAVDDWSRDGEWVVTVSNRQPPFGRGYQIYVMHPDGTHERRITEGTGLNCNPRFRPGTNQIAYHHMKRGYEGLWLVNLDGTNGKQLLTSDKNGAGSPDGICWSPDGAWLAVKRFDWQTDVPGILNPTHERMRVPGASHDRLEIIAADGSSHGVLALKDVTKIEFIDSADWR